MPVSKSRKECYNKGIGEIESMLETMEKVDYYVKDSQKAIYTEANVSKNGVVYFPFNEEKETIDWIDDMVSQWWDDETI